MYRHTDMTDTQTNFSLLSLYEINNLRKFKKKYFGGGGGDVARQNKQINKQYDFTWFTGSTMGVITVS